MREPFIFTRTKQAQPNTRSQSKAFDITPDSGRKL
jgi:hypothetical protein